MFQFWLCVKITVDLHLHLSDAFIQSDLQYIQGIHFFFC